MAVFRVKAGPGISLIGFRVFLIIFHRSVHCLSGRFCNTVVNMLFNKMSNGSGYCIAEKFFFVDQGKTFDLKRGLMRVGIKK